MDMKSKLSVVVMAATIMTGVSSCSLQTEVRNAEQVAETSVITADSSTSISFPRTEVTTTEAPSFDGIREVYVGLSGGQDVVDRGKGPVLFPLYAPSAPNYPWPPYVVEHDLHGGWEKFGTLTHGMQVRLSGLVTGTYTVGQIINVPKGGASIEFRKFHVMPSVMLQTCVPGTDRMIVVGLY